MLILDIDIKEVREDMEYSGSIHEPYSLQFDMSLPEIKPKDYEVILCGWSPEELALAVYAKTTIIFRKNGKVVNFHVAADEAKVLFQPLVMAIQLLFDRRERLGQTEGSFKVPLVTSEGPRFESPEALEHYLSSLNP